MLFVLDISLLYYPYGFHLQKLEQCRGSTITFSFGLVFTMRNRVSFLVTVVVFVGLMVILYLGKYIGRILTRTNQYSGGIKVVPEERCWLPKRLSGNLNLIRRQFKKHNNLQASTNIILLYTGLFFHPWWWGKNEKSMQKYTHVNHCKERNCFFTYNKDAFDIADIVIFHGVDLNKPRCIRKLSNSRPSRQKWILFIHESPLYTQRLSGYNAIFNWTMTYMRKSDIYVPYFSFSKLPKAKKSSVGIDFSQGKTGKVVWVVSHCGLLRDDYVLELEKYIDITVYGDCSVKFKRNMGRCNEWGNFCENELKRYKFYLAFENCFCKDYITEKFWEKGLKYGLVPVVMGSIDKDSDVIKGSYIDVNDFETIKGLADYLLYLDTNSTAYNEYFKWRYHYEIRTKVDSLCEVCKSAHDVTKESKVYENIDYFWSKELNCDPYLWKINQIKKQISKSKFEFKNRVA